MKNISNYLIDEINKEKGLTEKHQRILIAAVELISEKGYDKVTTAEIAKSAEVSEGTIFRYYKTKKDLLNYIILSSYLKLVAPICINNFVTEVLEKDYQSVEDLIRNLVYDRIEFAKKEESIVKILIQEFISQQDSREIIKNTFIEKAYPRISKAIQKIKENNHIIDLSTDEIIRIILSNLFGYFIQRFIICPNHLYDDNRDKEIITRTIIKSITASK